MSLSSNTNDFENLYIDQKLTAISQIHKLNPRDHLWNENNYDDLDYFVNNKLDNSLKNDLDVMIEVVKKNGRFLRFASDTLKANPTLVMTAVQNGNALVFAPENLKADRDIVIAAVKNHSGAIRFASKDLQTDPDIVYIANNPSPLEAGWVEKWRNDGIKNKYDTFYVSELSQKISWKRPVGTEFVYAPTPEYLHYTHFTVKNLKNLLNYYAIKVRGGLTKSQLQEIVRQNIENGIIHS